MKKSHDAVIQSLSRTLASKGIIGPENARGIFQLGNFELIPFHIGGAELDRIIESIEKKFILFFMNEPSEEKVPIYKTRNTTFS